MHYPENEYIACLKTKSSAAQSFQIIIVTYIAYIHTQSGYVYINMKRTIIVSLFKNVFLLLLF